MSENVNLMDIVNQNSGEDVFDDVVEYGDFDSESEDVEASSDDIEESAEEQDIEESIEDASEEPSKEESDDSREEEPESEKVEEDSEAEEEVSEESLKEQIESLELKVKLDDDTEVTLKDLKNDYIGQKEISRRFSELDVQKKQHGQDVEEINGYISEFAGKLKDGDSVGAMQYFGEFAGIPPYMIKEQLVAALRPEIIRRENMSAVEVQNEYLQHQSQYLNQQRTADQERRAMEQSQAELQNSVNQIREQHGIDENTWRETEEGLKQTLEEGEELTPELVAQTVQYGRMFEQAESIVSSFEGQLENQAQWVEELVSVKEKHPDFSEEDLKEVLKDAYAQVHKNSTEQKLAKKIESKKTKSVQTQKAPKAVEEEEIDPELEDWF